MILRCVVRQRPVNRRAASQRGIQMSRSAASCEDMVARCSQAHHQNRHNQAPPPTPPNETQHHRTTHPKQPQTTQQKRNKPTQNIDNHYAQTNQTSRQHPSRHCQQRLIRTARLGSHRGIEVAWNAVNCKVCCCHLLAGWARRERLPQSGTEMAWNAVNLHEDMQHTVRIVGKCHHIT
jgi:hypothetical protein